MSVSIELAKKFSATWKNEWMAVAEEVKFDIGKFHFNLTESDIFNQTNRGNIPETLDSDNESKLLNTESIILKNYSTASKVAFKKMLFRSK